MELLRILTLVYAAVLVVALAASLLAIWVYLRRIASVLGEVRAALDTMRDETQPFEAPMHQLQESITDSADDLETAREQFAHADERLTALAERLHAARLIR